MSELGESMQTLKRTLVALSFVDIWAERISQNGVIGSHLFKQICAWEKVIDVLESFTIVDQSDLNQYRIAYGVQVLHENGSTLTKLRWCERMSKAGYNPSVLQLFSGIYVEPGQRYCLLISKLADGLRQTEIRDHADNFSNFAFCMHRYSALFEWPREPITPDDPPERAPDGGGSRPRLKDSLAALKALDITSVLS